jgi:hypothetical protein
MELDTKIKTFVDVVVVLRRGAAWFLRHGDLAAANK